jgi:SpoVK/Ycf46/Vps4 family AAA+-type ATPase
MEQFTCELFSSPKGILFYGPPGTGKSAILLKMCEDVEVKLRTNQMVSLIFKF